MQFFCEVSKKAIKPSVAYVAKSARSEIGGYRISFLRGMLLRVVLGRPMVLQKRVNWGNDFAVGGANNKTDL